MTAERPGGLRAVFLPAWHDNPYQELLASGLAPLGVRVESLPRMGLFLPRMLRSGRPEIVHLHAPDQFVVYGRNRTSVLLRLAAFASQLLALRATGVRLVWTAHDLVNHEGRHPRLDRVCRLLTAALADAIIVHCAEARRAVTALLRVRAEDKVFVVPHGHYLDAYPPTRADRRTAREALRLPPDGTLLLFLGNLRRHKGLDALIDAFGTLRRDGVRLVIAGQPFTAEVGEHLAARIAGAPGVDFRPGFVPSDAVALYMRAADAVVCPFTSSLTSGSLALAMSFARACIAPRLGCIPEMLAAGGGFLYEPGNADALTAALRAAVDQASTLDELGRRNLAEIERRGWPSIARQTLAVYRECLSPEGRSRSGTAPRSS